MVDETAPSGPSPLRLVRGDATPEEVAAIMAVLTAPQAPAAPTFSRASEWPGSTRRLRRPNHPGPAAWRASALPEH